MVDSSSSESPRSSAHGGSDCEPEPSDPMTHVLPGPHQWDVLRRHTQRKHVSQAVWNEETQRVLKIRRGARGTGGPQPDDIPDVVAQYLTQAGFIHVARMQHMQIDASLISALVERWRPETHTFHMSQGEMTITLQDVAAILGLPTEGKVVSGATTMDWQEVCNHVFGNGPNENTELTSGNVRLSYFDRVYAHWRAVADNPHNAIYYTKAHIARMIGGWLLCDRSGGSVAGCRYIPLLAGEFQDIGSYSWGSAVLAHLFRQLCECTDVDRSDIGGCTTLLQIWAWLRFPPIAPPIPLPTQPEWHFGHRFNGLGRFKLHELLWYRDRLDTLCRDEVVWQPYLGYDFMGATVERQRLWMAVAPLICFHIVEYSQPDRCMRQFGRDQPIPIRPRKLCGVHDYTLRGKMDENWPRKLKKFIRRWETRGENIEMPALMEGLMSPNHGYMEWFRQRGRRYITRRAAKIGRCVDGLEMLHFMTTSDQFPNYTLEFINAEIGRIIAIFKETSRIEEAGPEAPPTQVPDEAQLSVDVGRHAKEGRGLGRRRRPMPPVSEPISSPRPRTSGWYRPPMFPIYGSQPHYYAPNMQEQAYQPSQAGTYPPMDSQSQQVYQASPVAMASGHSQDQSSETQSS
ncbi:serine/threonine-protein phosphatase 7 long form homolog [Gastrolobium bilobum]|uniref:serine/threonine-protein phosphatase 7 long form homolog n=1 Tax=Gastrolobium bilobum TaxID=150636 RepID=UPI002AB124B5|nr:serine/threonine-protein phosphatase 7 long form homolog [Gastrolobium bilobum]